MRLVRVVLFLALTVLVIFTLTMVLNERTLDEGAPPVSAPGDEGAVASVEPTPSPSASQRPPSVVIDEPIRMDPDSAQVDADAGAVAIEIPEESATAGSEPTGPLEEAVLEPEQTGVEPEGPLEAETEAPAEPELVRRLRERVSELPGGQFVYNRLDTMWRDRPETVLLRIAWGSEAAPRIPEALEGEPAIGTTPITPMMSAELRGTAGLKVDPPGLIKRRISDLSPTEWQWTVTPVRAEDRELLTLTLYIHVDEGEPYTLRTYRDQIEVQIGWWAKTKDFIANINLVWGFVVAAIPILWGAFAWLRGRKWRQSESQRKPWSPLGRRLERSNRKKP